MKEKKDLNKLIYESWYKQALRDREVANLCLENGHFEWACFCYQESTVKILKAALKKSNLESFRHSVFNLLETLSQKISIPEEFFEIAKEIDKHYIVSRYPGANMLKPPYENYSLKEAQRISKLSEKITDFVTQNVLNS